MKKLTITTLFILGMCSIVLANRSDTTQAPTLAKNTIYMEGGGNSIGLSLNYSRIIFQERETKLAIRVGLGTPFTTAINFPIELTLLYGKRHHLEVGPGYRVGVSDLHVLAEDEPDVEQIDINHSFTFRLGYRLQQNVGRSRIYASAALVLNMTNTSEWFDSEEKDLLVFPMPAVAVGISF